jgi:hypothetical protein
LYSNSVSLKIREKLSRSKALPCVAYKAIVAGSKSQLPVLIRSLGCVAITGELQIMHSSENGCFVAVLVKGFSSAFASTLPARYDASAHMKQLESQREDVRGI